MRRMRSILVLAMCMAVSIGACAQSTGQSVPASDASRPVSSSVEPASSSPSGETPSKITPPWDANALEDCEHFLLFHYALTTDGAYSEDAAARLKDVFNEDAEGLVHAVSLQTPENQEQLAALLAYGKSYFGIEAFQEELYALKEKCSDPEERETIERMLSECENPLL